MIESKDLENLTRESLFNRYRKPICTAIATISIVEALSGVYHVVSNAVELGNTINQRVDIMYERGEATRNVSRELLEKKLRGGELKYFVNKKLEQERIGIGTLIVSGLSAVIALY